MDLKTKYGLYKLKKDTILFRQSNNINLYEHMFFGFSIHSTYSSYYNSNEIQLWRIKKDTNVFFMIKDYSNIYKKISAIVDIYNYFNPNEILNDNDDVYIKKEQNIRNKFIQKLKSHEINSWINSVENKNEMELFLFDSIDSHIRIIEFLKSIDKKSKEFKYYHKIDNFDIKNISK